MDAVYTLWSKPRKSTSPRMSGLEMLLLAVSATQWRSRNGRALLYCDTAYARYLDAVGLSGLFDEVDTVTLDGAAALPVEADVFWSIGKVLSARAATPPFVSLDCDLIAWDDLTPNFNAADILVSHWESTAPSAWYPGPRELSTPPGLSWPTWMLTNAPAANVSLLYIADDVVRHRYQTEALRFAVGNPARPRLDIGVAPELLFAEQCLLTLLARELEVTVTALIDATWSPAADKFEAHDETLGEWNPIAVLEQDAPITHGWFHKSLLPAADEQRTRLLTELHQVLASHRPNLADRIANSAD